MKNLLKKYFPLFIAIIIFVGFGLYHISKFETIDEHFWKYDRIEKYFNGIKQHNFKKTRINDKPGVTLALISGLGLHFSPPLSEHEDMQRENDYLMTKNNGHTRKLYKLYKINETQRLNYALRLPILLFNGLVMLPLLFWLMTRAFDRRIASIGIIFIGINPILIGISQIINPDALLWSFSAGALLSFFALLKTSEKKFIILTGVLTGFALLSKYTANLLFIFYTIAYIYYTTLQHNNIPPLKKTLVSYAKKIFGIAIISWITLAIFMPAVIIAPKHFLYATLYSPVLDPIVSIFASILHINNLLFTPDETYKIIPLALFSLLIFTIVFVIIPPIIVVVFKKFPKILPILGKITLIMLLLIFVFSFINAWFDIPLFSLDNLKEVSRANGEVSFPQFNDEPIIIFWLKALLVQSQNFVFSLSTVVTILLFTVAIFVLLNKKVAYNWFVYFAFTLPFIFFGGALMSNVFVNVRYSLMLYPLFMIIATLGVTTICDRINWKFKKPMFLAIILVTGLYTLFTIKPFYFNFTNTLLPHKYVVTDAWGYGFYEAAQYLNSLDNAKNLVVWVDRNGLCQFFTGKCISSREIYLDHTDVDYLLVTRRGTLIREPVPVTKDPNKTDISFKKYYTPEFFNNPLWQLNIDNRPENFIKIIKIEK